MSTNQDWFEMHKFMAGTWVKCYRNLKTNEIGFDIDDLCRACGISKERAAQICNKPEDYLDIDTDKISRESDRN